MNLGDIIQPIADAFQMFKHFPHVHVSKAGNQGCDCMILNVNYGTEMGLNFSPTLFLGAQTMCSLKTLNMV